MESWGGARVEHLDDLDLVARARAGDDRAIYELLNRYRGFARAKARSYYLSGSDRQDVVQEGMIGLYKAVRDFDLHQDTPFRAFAELCISRQILTAIKSANRHKHQPLNSSISLDAPAYADDDAGPAPADRLVAPAADPIEVIFSAEDIEDIRRSLRDDLTRLETEVLTLYMTGKSYDEIVEALGSRTKCVDNALQRIRKKLQRHLDRRDGATA